MSASDANITTQRRRHRPSLVGIGASLTLAAAGLAVLLIWGGLPSDEQAAPDRVPAASAQN